MSTCRVQRDTESCTRRFFGVHIPIEFLEMQVPKYVHPATKMCTPGAGCTLNFEHWCILTNIHLYMFVNIYFFFCVFPVFSLLSDLGMFCI